jgi:hypothetical protein
MNKHSHLRCRWRLYKPADALTTNVNGDKNRDWKDEQRLQTVEKKW